MRFNFLHILINRLIFKYKKYFLFAFQIQNIALSHAVDIFNAGGDEEQVFHLKWPSKI